MANSEQWRAVAGHDGRYEVSDQGRVRSLPRVSEFRNRWGGVCFRKLPGTILKPLRHTGGYWRVTFWTNGVCDQQFIHTLVLEAFVGPRPGRMQVCHNNGEKPDNRLCNLRWDTPSANQQDRERHGTGRIGKRFTQRKYDDQLVTRIRSMARSLNRTQVANALCLPRTTVSDIINRRTHAT